MKVTEVQALQSRDLSPQYTDEQPSPGLEQNQFQSGIHNNIWHLSVHDVRIGKNLT